MTYIKISAKLMSEFNSIIFDPILQLIYIFYINSILPESQCLLKMFCKSYPAFIRGEMLTFVYNQ